MKNTFGTAITCTIFGESHGATVGITIDGLVAGIKIDLDNMAFHLGKRRGKGDISTSRVEKDTPNIVSGYFNGYTTGTPLTMLFPNENIDSSHYHKHLPRPSHSDFVAEVKYRGYQDHRGGGHFSGRLTAPIVAVGSIFRDLLAHHGVTIGSHILSCGDIHDSPFATTRHELDEQINRMIPMSFPVLDGCQKAEMRSRILALKADGDSIGGVVELAVTNLPIGIGEPFFSSVESILSLLYFSIPGVKGVEFGDGFALCSQLGSDANDQMTCVDGRVTTLTNHSGGINGGITNGSPLIAHVGIKPVASIKRPQSTVNLDTLTQETITLTGRHDPTILSRVCPVIEAMTAIGLADLYAQQYGQAWMVQQ